MVYSYMNNPVRTYRWFMWKKKKKKNVYNKHTVEIAYREHR